MGCNFISVKAAESCKADFAGTGNALYLAQLTETQREAIEEDEDAPVVTIDSEILKTIKFQKVVLKNKVNKVDYQSNPDGGGYTATANVVINKEVTEWAKNSKIMNNTGNWIALLADGKGAYYFLGSKFYDNGFDDKGATGDAPDSEKGSTVTITSGPHEWEYLKINGSISYTEPSGEGSSLVPGYYTLTAN